ncbi:MAG: bifunctional UDP-N-acetylglucosamine diphosphorylase/glucosamine-1-phosphate N-acetyltransferase GlmU [Anaerolineae bacterium]|nr:bifunctional UDP-N-acetylglucosamine diphosphorylase/glucosamine-1-phosphate N-acetyltransferase GlmU [Anaerolineae bacterium]
MELSVLILAAGKSTRFRSRTSKVLHPLAGRPMILYSVDAAQTFSPYPPTLVVGDNELQLRALLGDRVRYVRQDQPLGTGHAVLQAREALQGEGDAVLVSFGDMPLLRRETLEAVVDRYRQLRPTISMLTVVSEDSMAYGRVIRDASGGVVAVVEEAVASPEQLAIKELNCSVYCFDAAWLWDNLPFLQPSPKGELYLTDMVGMAVAQGRRVEPVVTYDADEVLGPNNRVQLAQAERVLRRRINEELMLSGVTLLDPNTTYVDHGVKVGQDTTIWPNTFLSGQTTVGEDCHIGPNTFVRDCHIADRCTVRASFVEGARIAEDCSIGPFARIRPGTTLDSGVHMGSFGEVKGSHLGQRVHMGHFSYVGDAEVGAEANIGAGAVTCNYDGETKHRTRIGERAFVGSGSMLVAPLEIGPGAVIGAGSVVTHDVPAGALVYGVPARPRRG